MMWFVETVWMLPDACGEIVVFKDQRDRSQAIYLYLYLHGCIDVYMCECSVFCFRYFHGKICHHVRFLYMQPLARRQEVECSDRYWPAGRQTVRWHSWRITNSDPDGKTINVSLFNMLGCFWWRSQRKKMEGCYFQSRLRTGVMGVTSTNLQPLGTCEHFSSKSMMCGYVVKFNCRSFAANSGIGTFFGFTCVLRTACPKCPKSKRFTYAK